MRGLLTAILICVLLSQTTSGQYYLRGEVKDEKGRLLPGVMIKLFSKGNLQFFSGDNGLFGIPSPKQVDTITLSFDGYETVRQPVPTKQYQSLVMKMLPATASLMRNRLASITKNLTPKEQFGVFSAIGESYNSMIENSFIDAKIYPETGFALNIDRASYSNIRRFLNNDLNVPIDAVRIEEMLNYFNFSTAKQENKESQFTCNSNITNCPWNIKNNLLFINLNAPKLSLEDVPLSNLVFLIDISGSMDKPNRLPLLQAGFKLLVKNLRAIDTLSIVTYGGGVAVMLPPTSGADKLKINQVIDSLTASGDSPGEGAIRTAYAIAKRAYKVNGNNRVILATDGDFNVGQTSDKQLEDMITIQRQSGIFLTCLGVGMGNYKDSKLETLAKKGNGNFAYLDNAMEAEKVLVTEFTKTIYNVANDAYVGVKFDAEKIKNYRLIGFDNKRDAIADITSQVEGGEVGSGHNILAIFEIELADGINARSNKIATLNLQYKPAEKQEEAKQIFPINYLLQDLNKADSSLRFATAVTMFGELLKNSTYAKDYSFTDVWKLAETAIDNTNYSQKEFMVLVQKANRIYAPLKKKKR